MPRIKTVSNRSPKRSRREKGSSSQTPTHTPTHDTMGIIFPSRTSSERFASLAARQIMPTKFVDRAALDALGITEGVRHLFQTIECGHLLRVYAPTYRRITLEVLSTLSCSMSGRLLRFRVFNEDHEISFDDIGDTFHCTPGNVGEGTGPTSNYSTQFSALAFWNQITGLVEPYDPRLAKGSSIPHPCMRIAHRILSSTIFCRSDSGSVSHIELFFLYGMANYLSHVSMDGGAFIAQKLLRTAESTSGEICCGGLITYLLTESYLQIPIPEDMVPVEGIDRLTIAVFRRMHFINPRRDGRFDWLIGAQHTHHSLLPDHARTRVDGNTNWLFPPQEEEGQGGDQHPPPHAPQPQDVDFNARFNALTLRVDGVQQSLDGLRQDLYGFFEHQGYHGYQRPPAP